MKETTMTRTVHRLLATAAVAACALTIGACGDDDANPQATLPGPSSTTITPGQPQAPNLPSLDGYLISATESEVVLKTADGDQKLAVAEQDVPQIGIEHLQSHAGINTLGFRVYYTEQDGKRYVKQAVEIPPPAFE
jgi:hypothetical protein